jgi:hypothetical protein
MKKYVITESQLKTIVEKYDELPKEVIKSKPMTFQNFINVIKMEKEGGESDKGDLKSFVSAKMAGDRAKNYLNKTDDALDKLAGGKGSIKGYSLASDDAVLADADDLAVIVLSLLYYFYKEGKLPLVKVKDVQMNYEKNYNVIKTRGLDDFKPLLAVKLTSDYIVYLMPGNENISIVSTPAGSIQVHVNNLGNMAILVKLNFMEPSVLNKFYNDVIKNKDTMGKIKKAINKNFTVSVEGGSLVFKF